MKKIISFVLAFICIFALVGCTSGNSVKIDFPFKAADVVKIEIHYITASAHSERMVIEEKDEIKALYKQFEKLSFELKDREAQTTPDLTYFCFILSDGSEYDLSYFSYGVKNGRLKSSAGDFDYFTSSDINGLWASIGKEFETDTAG